MQLKRRSGRNGNQERNSKGIQKGIEQNTIASIKSLIETLKLTAEEAMNALKVPDSDREKYFSMLKQQ